MSRTPTSPFEQLQRDLAGRLEADSYFSDISVYVMRPREEEGFVGIQSMIEKSLAGHVVKARKAGAAVIVSMATGDATDLNAPGPRMDLSLVVRCQELPVINMGPRGTGKPVEDIAARVLQLGHLFNAGRGSVLVASDQGAFTPLDTNDAKVTVDAKFSIKSGVAGLAKTTLPVITSSGLTIITLMSATAGAALYYTTDGTLPSSVNPTATLWAGGPVTVAAACTLRVAAEASGYVQSDVKQATLS